MDTSDSEFNYSSNVYCITLKESFLVYGETTTSSSEESLSQQCKDDIIQLSQFSYSSYMDSVQNGINTTLPYALGLCLPRSCNTTQDIQSALNTFMLTASVIAPPGVRTTTHCYAYGSSRNNEKWTAGPIIVLCVCVLIAIMVLVGTALELYRNEKYRALGESTSKESKPPLQQQPKDNSYCAKIFLSFSLVRNYRSFMNVSEYRKFGALDGIRSIGAIWIVIAHTFSSMLYSGVDNSSYIFKRETKKFSFQAIVADHHCSGSWFWFIDYSEYRQSTTF
ncbi:hypothetical protein PPL_12243 [Heterostelium album PN500]|uniref:Nose resistant-to-fluoxetine protein N-terminal domain-containing protein n=1 Tax=Heterostelium pallidum (strain ATCC 26659 / Pp 5 / PN500) TaxID=670386 RepID=D3BM35_HETP5|nr:hypothetical protein PPL_12243 [Heterostelium album PN500]EFA77636.1 hypothetical protein PPL_12243 [Heterostelium album PN500]|eukprot:XP_020429764.1 hypothetical protein PPL_12243 [Heterostelium album PN500]